MAVPTDPAESASNSTLRMQILGPMRIWRDGAEVDPGPRQQAFLLALLLAHEGRPVGVTELVDLLWGEEAPASALNVLHKYVGNLRRLLEPALPARGVGAHLLRRGNGYLFTAWPGELDLVDFRRVVAAASSALAEQRRGTALDRYEEALALWSGPAGSGPTPGPGAMAVFAGLDNSFFEVCLNAAKLALVLDRPDGLVAPLQRAASIAPLNEAIHASLITVLGAAGRPAEALTLFQTIRARLAEDLGLDPGPALEAARHRVLAQSATAALSAPGPVDPAADVLVGRADELAVLRRAMEPAYAGGTALVVVEGEPGAGKTRVLEEVAAEAHQRQALVVWGSCLQGDGTPSMWPWVQVVSALVGTLPAGLRREWLDSDLGRLVEPRDSIRAGPVFPDSGGQFRLFEHVVTVVADIAARRPLVLIIDDLHWADVTSLQLFGHLAARLPDGAVVFGALRDRAPAPGTELARVLAAASRVPGHRRIVLGPLDIDAVAELVRRETGRDPGTDAIRRIRTRTGGNPFFVRELSRFLADGGGFSTAAPARSGVPSTVRDVVRDRLSQLDGDAEALLQIAALMGRDVGLGLLARVADLDVATCLTRLEPLHGLGLLEPTPADPYSVRFTHDLIRESVTEITTPKAATHLHLRIANALEQLGGDEESAAERLAFHLWSAGPLAGSARTANALVRAGSRAAAKSALEAAERQLGSAVQVAREAGLAELELSALAQLTAVVGMRSMYGTASLMLLERAEQLAGSLGREQDAAGFLFSRWTAHHQAINFERSEPLARRLLEQGSASNDPVIVTYGLQAWGIHQYHVGNIGEGYRYASQSKERLLAGLYHREENPVLADLQLLMTGMLAEIAAVHGDVDEARTLLRALETAADDNPYRITVWSTMVTRTASLLGEPVWAMRGAERGIAADPGFSFIFLGTYQRLVHCWASVLAGDDPDRMAAAIAEAQRLIAANLLDPPRSCVATWYALLGEMHLAAGMIAEAAVSLDRADLYLTNYGQRYPEALTLLLRARLLQAQGAPVSAVRAAAETARSTALDREAGLFARRAENFLTGLG
ncbi:MAG: BTAD domain-containing putative transcriptional regulator [Mycobacterium sp.]